MCFLFHSRNFSQKRTITESNIHVSYRMGNYARKKHPKKVIVSLFTSTEDWNYGLYGQRRLRSDCADAQSDQSLLCSFKESSVTTDYIEGGQKLWSGLRPPTPVVLLLSVPRLFLCCSSVLCVCGFICSVCFACICSSSPFVVLAFPG